MPALSFVTFLIFKVKSSNTVTASYNYVKYFQVIKQPVSYMQFMLRPQMVSRVSLAGELLGAWITF